MKEIQLTITAESPLAIGRQKPGGSVSEAQPYIPGSVIRGAIASKIVRQASEHSEQPGGDFQRLFLDEAAAVFSNAYPTIAGHQTWVIPATAVSSKAEPGFRTEDDTNGGVFDTLIDSFCAEGYGHLYAPNFPTDGSRVEPYTGFYSVDGGVYRSASVATRLLTQVGINRRRATAQENILYSIEAISEKRQLLKESGEKEWQPTTFSGYIRLEDAELAELLVDYINTQTLRLGGSASRGLGKVSITATLTDYRPDTATRIRAFNTALRSRWQLWSIFGNPTPLPESRQFFTLNLHSDAILTDHWRRTTVISPEMLTQMAGVNDSDLQLHAAHSSYDYRSGWNAAWGLMKDVELVTNKGAVYLFSTAMPEQWLPALEQLERRGIGERTPEGFGQVQVCNEFHHVFREAAV